jgi:tRNA modification GTPase
VFTEGVQCAIIGRPNVGKSTLLNAILSEDRAITHATPGTTRDVLQATVRIHDVPLILMDTAGLRETDDAIEKIGVQRTLTAAGDAELILYVTTAQDGITAEDAEMLERLTDKKLLLIFNKSDETVGGGATPHGLNVSISALTGEGLDNLYTAIAALYASGEIEADDADLITSARHADLLEKTVTALEAAIAQLADGQPEDLISISLRTAYLSLGEILGEQVHDDIVERIFAEFCVGK